MFEVILMSDYPIVLLDSLATKYDFEKYSISSYSHPDSLLIFNRIKSFNSYVDGVSRLTDKELEIFFSELVDIHSLLFSFKDEAGFSCEKLFFGLPAYLVKGKLEALILQRGMGWMPGYYDVMESTTPLMNEYIESSLTCCDVSQIYNSMTPHSLRYLRKNTSNSMLIRFLAFLIQKMRKSNSPDVLMVILQKLNDFEEISCFGILSEEDKAIFTPLLTNSLELYLHQSSSSSTSYKESFIFLWAEILKIEDPIIRMFLLGEFVLGFKFVNRISGNSTTGNKEFFITRCLEYLLLAKNNPSLTFSEHPFEIARFVRKWLYIMRDSLLGEARLLYLISELREYMNAILSSLVGSPLDQRLGEYPIHPFISYIQLYRMVHLPSQLLKETANVNLNEGIIFEYGEYPINLIFFNISPLDLLSKSEALSKYYVPLSTEGDVRIFIKYLCIILNNNIIHLATSGFNDEDWSTILRDRNDDFYDIFYNSLQEIVYFSSLFLPAHAVDTGNKKEKKERILAMVREHFIDK